MYGLMYGLRKKKSKKGFTLIELIVVIAILGILALIAIPRFVGLTENARQKADTATAVTIKNAALVAYYDTLDAETAVTVDKTYLQNGNYLASDFAWEYSDGTAITAVSVDDGVVTLTPDWETPPTS